MKEKTALVLFLLIAVAVTLGGWSIVVLDTQLAEVNQHQVDTLYIDTLSGAKQHEIWNYVQQQRDGYRDGYRAAFEYSREFDSLCAENEQLKITLNILEPMFYDLRDRTIWLEGTACKK